MFDVRDPWCQVQIIANLGIVTGYLIIPVTALRLVPMRTSTRISGMAFFITCGITHAYMAFSGPHHARDWTFWLMIVNHVVQAFTVWAFVLGLAAEVRGAVAIRRRRRWKTSASEVPRDRLPDGQ
jgi:hypothetical protein